MADLTGAGRTGGSIPLRGEGGEPGPFVVLAGPANPANGTYGCVGTADIGTPPLHADVRPLLDGTQPGFPGLLYRIGPNGFTTLTFSLPAGMPPGPLANLQALVFQPPGAACPVVLTAAFYLIVGP